YRCEIEFNVIYCWFRAKRLNNCSTGTTCLFSKPSSNFITKKNDSPIHSDLDYSTVLRTAENMKSQHDIEYHSSFMRDIGANIAFIVKENCLDNTKCGQQPSVSV
ncbi:hypothetical protein J6590_101316, partial [Homalodisca vitripennis]